MTPDVVRRCFLALAVALLSGCWDEPVKETVTIDLRQPRRVGLSVVVELESARELQDDPGGRRAVEQAAALLVDGRHDWNERFAALDCERESGGWQKREREIRRYELSAECSDPDSLARLFADRQLVVELSWEPGGGELRLVPNGGGSATRADRQRLERQLDEFGRTMVRYVDAARKVARRAAAEPERAALFWEAVLVENDSEAIPGLGREEKAAVEGLLEAIGDLLAAFSRQGGEPESLDALARRVTDPLPMRLELVPPTRAELEVDGFVAADAVVSSEAGGCACCSPSAVEAP
jgi:hypothetical protein